MYMCMRMSALSFAPSTGAKKPEASAVVALLLQKILLPVFIPPPPPSHSALLQTHPTTRYSRPRGRPYRSQTVRQSSSSFESAACSESSGAGESERNRKHAGSGGHSQPPNGPGRPLLAKAAQLATVDLQSVSKLAANAGLPQNISAR